MKFQQLHRIFPSKFPLVVQHSVLLILFCQFNASVDHFPIVWIIVPIPISCIMCIEATSNQDASWDSHCIAYKSVMEISILLHIHFDGIDCDRRRTMGYEPLRSTFFSFVVPNRIMVLFAIGSLGMSCTMGISGKALLLYVPFESALVSKLFKEYA